MLHDIFISYRRNGGEHLAGRIYDALKAKGYAVFLDVSDLKSGRFDEALVEKIKEATDFVLILTPGCLDRCKNEDDWLRKEIRCAFQYNQNIVPVFASGFEWSLAPELPDDISLTPTLNGPRLVHEMFSASIDRLASQFLKSKAAEASIHPTALNRLSNVKHRVKDFVGRVDKLEALESKFLDLDEPTIVVIKGLGGTGKTSLAIKYAEISKERYRACLCVDADNEEAIKSSFSDLFNVLYDREVLEEEDRRIARVLKWLMDQKHWLLIVDNANDPKVVKEFFDRSDWSFDEGHILITSRGNFRGWQDSETLSLGPFTPQDAVDYLFTRTNRSAENILAAGYYTGGLKQG